MSRTYRSTPTNAGNFILAAMFGSLGWGFGLALLVLAPWFAEGSGGLAGPVGFAILMAATAGVQSAIMRRGIGRSGPWVLMTVAASLIGSIPLISGVMDFHAAMTLPLLAVVAIQSHMLTSKGQRTLLWNVGNIGGLLLAVVAAKLTNVPAVAFMAIFVGQTVAWASLKPVRRNASATA